MKDREFKASPANIVHAMDAKSANMSIGEIKAHIEEAALKGRSIMKQSDVVIHHNNHDILAIHAERRSMQPAYIPRTTVKEILKAGFKYGQNMPLTMSVLAARKYSWVSQITVLTYWRRLSGS